MTDLFTVEPGVKPPWYYLGVTGDGLMDNKLLAYLQGTTTQISDVGEVLDTASRIDTHASWYREWVATATRVQRDAEASRSRGHAISAGKAFMRAANYFRASLIHDDGRDAQRIAFSATNARDCFDLAVELLSLPVTPMPIPYEGTTLPASFVRSPRAGDLAPVIIINQGFDAWPEETWWTVQGGLERGYHAVLLHGPGQGLARRLQGLPYRYDWERVITPTVDTVLAQPGVDPRRIILDGLSFGGYLAPRAAAFEHRIHTCIANPGLVNFFESTIGLLPPGIEDLIDSDPAKIDALVDDLGPEGDLLRFYAVEVPARFGETTISGWLRTLRNFDLSPVIDQIRCQVLVMDGEAESLMEGQSRRLYDAIDAPKDYMYFTAEDTALEHCQAGATLVAEGRLFDWLDEHVRDA